MTLRSCVFKSYLVGGLWVGVLGGAAGCSSGTNGGTATGAVTANQAGSGSGTAGNTGTSTGTSSTAGSSSSTGSSSTAGSGSGGDENGGSGGGPVTDDERLDPLEPLDPEDICDTIELSAEFLPVDMLIMLDRSTSMTQPVPSGETRWEAITSGLEEFFEQPDAGDVRLAFDIFDNPEDLVDGKQGTYLCEAESYSTPEVELAPIDEAGPDILEAIGPVPEGAFTPMYPALEGALLWAATNAAENPDRATAVLLATDGLPTSMNQCNDEIRDISLLAEAAYESEDKIRTFVLGVAVGGANLDVIAERGGGLAFVADGEGQDVQAQIVEAMKTIVNQPPGCDIALPDIDTDAGVLLDTSKAQVVVTDLYNGAVTAVPLIPEPASCIANTEIEGFFFNSDGETLTLCPASCKRLGRGEVRLDLACRPFAPLQ